MTPARQPQHCDHECVCRKYHDKGNACSKGTTVSIYGRWLHKIQDCTYDTRPHTSATAPAEERIGSIRHNIYQEDAYLIERVNAGMGEWEYVIQYCGEYYATAPSEDIARNIVEMATHTCPVLSPQHDAQVAKAERERVLVELLDITKGVWNLPDMQDRMRAMIASLRQPEPQP